MFIVTPEKTDQLSYIAAEVYQAGTNTPAFDQFPDAKFITVMGENHTVLSTWKKMFGSFLPQMTKGDLDVFNDYYHDGWGHMYIACQLAFGAAETIEQALKNLMYSIEKARGYNRRLIPSSMLSEMEHHLANRLEWMNELELWTVANIYARPLEGWIERVKEGETS
jgi:hypothetical protein